MLLFVTASHQTGLDTRSMNRRSIKVEIRGGEDQARAKAQALVTDASSPPKGGPAEAEGLMASSLPLLNRVHCHYVIILYLF